MTQQLHCARCGGLRGGSSSASSAEGAARLVLPIPGPCPVSLSDSAPPPMPSVAIVVAALVLSSPTHVLRGVRDFTEAAEVEVAPVLRLLLKLSMPWRSRWKRDVVLAAFSASDASISW